LNDYDTLRRKATLAMQDRMKAILKEIASAGRVSLTDSLEIEAIHRLWNSLGLQWVDE
jgi:hypothetical protein